MPHALTEPLAGAARVLCVRLDNAGDVVLLGPALRALRASLPGARIDLMASRAGAAVVPLLPWVDDVLVERVVWQDAQGRLPLDPSRELALVERIAAPRYDAILIFASFAQTPWPAAYVAYLAGIPVRIAAASEFGGSILSHPVSPLPRETHEAERDLHLVESVGVPVLDRHLRLTIPADVELRVQRLLDSHGVAPGSRPIVVAPGASAAARRWDPDRFAATARRIAARTGRGVLVTGSAAEAPAVERVAAGVPGSIPLAGMTDLPELAALVARSGLVLTGNTLAMHLADAFDRPVVVAYSGTDLESHWAPRRAPAVLFRRPTPCAPCLRFDCPIGLPCLDLDPDELAAAAVRLLGRPSPTPEDRWIVTES